MAALHPFGPITGLEAEFRCLGDSAVGMGGSRNSGPGPGRVLPGTGGADGHRARKGSRPRWAEERPRERHGRGSARAHRIPHPPTTFTGRLAVPGPPTQCRASTTGAIMLRQGCGQCR